MIEGTFTVINFQFTLLIEGKVLFLIFFVLNIDMLNRAFK